MNYKDDFMNTIVIIPYEGNDWEFKLGENYDGDRDNVAIINSKTIENRLSMYKELTNNNYTKYKLQEVLIKEYEGDILGIMPISILIDIKKNKVDIIRKKLLIIDIVKEEIIYTEHNSIKQMKKLYKEISYQNISLIQPIELNSDKHKTAINKLNKKISKLNKGKRYKISKLCSIHEKSVSLDEIISSAISSEYNRSDLALSKFLIAAESYHKDKINKELLKRPNDSKGLETTVVPISYKNKDVVIFIFRYLEGKQLIEYGRIYFLDNNIYISKEHLFEKRMIKIVPDRDTLDSIILTQNELDNINTIANHPIDYSGTKYENNLFMKNNSLKDPLSHLINLIDPINNLTSSLYTHHPLLKLTIDRQVEKTRGIISDLQNNYPTNFQEQLLNIMVIDSFYAHNSSKSIEDIIQINKERLDIINELPYSDEDKVDALFYVKVITALINIKREYGETSVERIYYKTVGEPMSYYMYKYLNRYQNKNLSDEEFLEILKIIDKIIKSKEISSFECPVLNKILKQKKTYY